MLSKKLEEVSGQLRKEEAKNSSLVADLRKATSAVDSAESEVSALKAKLQELEKHLSGADVKKEMGAKLQVSVTNYLGC